MKWSWTPLSVAQSQFKAVVDPCAAQTLFKGYQTIYFHLKQSKTLEVILSRISRSFSLNQLCNDVWRDDDVCLVVKLCVKFGELAGRWAFSDISDVISDMSPDWLVSDPSNRPFAVRLLSCGVPQGSVLGPFMFLTVLRRKQPYRLWRLTLTSSGFK